MKQVQLLRSFDSALSVMLREAQRYERELLLTQGTERYVLKSIRNRICEAAMGLQFSKYVGEAYGKKAALTDIDCVLYVKGRVTAIFEMKRRREDFRKYIMANARQFFILRKFARMFDVPLIYLYRIEEFQGDCYRILEVDPEEYVKVMELGNGHARDHYAVWDVNRSQLLTGEDLPQYLRGLR